MRIPAPEIGVAPDPMANEWKMLAVGFPVWITGNQVTEQNASTTQQGITIQMRASAGPTVVDFGDGTTRTCVTMSPRPPSAPAQAESPDCGHTYQRKGTYTITATTTWTITWSALGQSGTVTMARSNSTTLRVGELTAVLVER